MKDCFFHVMKEHLGYDGPKNIHEFIINAGLAPGQICEVCNEEIEGIVYEHIRKCYGDDDQKAAMMRPKGLEPQTKQNASKGAKMR